MCINRGVNTTFYQSLISDRINNMSPPITMCITKEEREKAGYRSFRQWIEDPKNMYIRLNVQKYSKDSTPSNWVNPFTCTMEVKMEISSMNHS